MKIRSMTASFGKLDHAHLELSHGLNILHAPNEGGKSTWCAFIRAMLYGIPSRERDKKGYLAEKNRYQPWSGAPMEGEMTVEWQGREITIRRFTKGAIPFGGFSAVYTDTQQPVPGLTAQTCGEVLLGVGREVWERSAFIGSAPTLAIDGTPELERRISALFSSGEEDVSFSQTEATLREWLRRRKHNRSGLIPALEEELSQVDRTLGSMADAQRRLAQVAEHRTQLQEQQQELEGERHIHRRLAQRDMNTRFAQALQEQQEQRAQLDDLLARQHRYGPLPHRDRLLDAQRQVQRLTLQEEELDRQIRSARSAPPTPPQDPRFAGMNGTHAVRLAQDERTQAEALLTQLDQQERQRRRAALPALALLGVATLVGVAANRLLVGLLGGAVLALLWSILALTRYKTVTARLQTQVQTILTRWQATAPQQITEIAEAYRCQTEAFAHAKEDYWAEQQRLTDRRQDLDRASADLIVFVRTFAPQVRSLPGCSAALSEVLELDDRLREQQDRLDLISRRCDDLRAQGAQAFDSLELLHTPTRSVDQTEQALAQVQTLLAELDRQEALISGTLLTLGDRPQLEARKDRLSAQLARRNEEYQALTLALEALHQANGQLQQRFAPELNRRSSEILSALTGGRYDTLILDRDFEAAARSTDSLLPHSTLALSRGTADQIYLAVRLAVCQLCLGEDAPSPLVLDDALLTFDDARMALAVDYLSRLDRQVILFSCQLRESRLGAGHILSLHS